MTILGPKKTEDRNLSKMSRQLLGAPELTALNIKINKELHLRFKVKTIQQRVAMTDIVEAAIREYLEK